MEMNNLIKEYNERIEQETGVENAVLSTIWETLQHEMEEEYEYDDDVALREQDLMMRGCARGEEPPRRTNLDQAISTSVAWIEHLSYS
jgi:hypothetical protein